MRPVVSGEDSTDTFRWKLVFFPWLPVRSLKQARFLTLVGTASLGAIAAISLVTSLYYQWIVGFAASDTNRLSASVFGLLAIYFACCALGTLFNSRIASCIGILPITLMVSFGLEMIVITLFSEPTFFSFAITIFSMYFFGAWMVFSGLKGTFANSRLKRNQKRQHYSVE